MHVARKIQFEDVLVIYIDNIVGFFESVSFVIAFCRLIIIQINYSLETSDYITYIYIYDKCMYSRKRVHKSHRAILVHRCSLTHST